ASGSPRTSDSASCAEKASVWRPCADEASVWRPAKSALHGVRGPLPVLDRHRERVLVEVVAHLQRGVLVDVGDQACAGGGVLLADDLATAMGERDQILARIG